MYCVKRPIHYTSVVLQAVHITTHAIQVYRTSYECIACHTSALQSHKSSLCKTGDVHVMETYYMEYKFINTNELKLIQVNLYVIEVD